MLYRLEKFGLLVAGLLVFTAVMLSAFVMMPLVMVLMLVSGALGVVGIDVLGDTVRCILAVMMKSIRRATVRIRELVRKADSLAEQYGMA